jgi:hypothetical protein
VPTLKQFFPADGLSFGGVIYNSVYNGTFGNATATSVSLTTMYGQQIVFKGSFTVAGGVVTGGTVTGFDAYVGTTIVGVGEGYNFSYADLTNAIQQAKMVSFEAIQDLWYDPAKYIGSKYADSLTGGTVILGKGGDDRLYGGDTTEKMKGGDGSDLFYHWGDTSAKMWGGDGSDWFILFSGPTAKPGIIKDFTPGEDMIGLDGSVYRDGLGLGILDKSEFGIGKEAEGSEKIFYNKKTGELMLDADGAAGPGAPVLIATLDDHLALKAKHLAVGYFD